MVLKNDLVFHSFYITFTIEFFFACCLEAVTADGSSSPRDGGWTDAGLEACFCFWLVEILMVDVCLCFWLDIKILIVGVTFPCFSLDVDMLIFGLCFSCFWPEVNILILVVCLSCFWPELGMLIEGVCFCWQGPNQNQKLILWRRSVHSWIT